MENKKMELARLFQEVRGILKHSVRKEFEDMEITAPQSMVLMILARKGSLRVSDLSRELSLSDSTVSGIVDRLEKQKIVIRRRSDSDKRVVFVELSEEFTEKHRNLHKNLSGHFERLLSEASEEEIDKIFEGLQILKRLLEKDHSFKGENSVC